MCQDSENCALKKVNVLHINYSWYFKKLKQQQGLKGGSSCISWVSSMCQMLSSVLVIQHWENRQETLLFLVDWWRDHVIATNHIHQDLSESLHTDICPKRPQKKQSQALLVIEIQVIHQSNSVPRQHYYLLKKQTFKEDPSPAKLV